MNPVSLKENDLRQVLEERGYSVKILAEWLGLGLRTTERLFNKHFGKTPKAWLMEERMRLARPLLAWGHSNKEVAASLGYAYESNFCRDFKRYYGCAPQEFAHLFGRSDSIVSRFGKELSRFD